MNLVIAYVRSWHCNSVITNIYISVLIKSQVTKKADTLWNYWTLISYLGNFTHLNVASKLEEESLVQSTTMHRRSLPQLSPQGHLCPLNNYESESSIARDVYYTINHNLNVIKNATEREREETWRRLRSTGAEELKNCWSIGLIVLLADPCSSPFPSP